MKWYHYISIGMLLPLTIWASFRIGLKKGQERPIIAKMDTITIYKEKMQYKPKEVARIKVGTISVPEVLALHDTVTHTIVLEREQVVYADTCFVAWVSGYEPSLDSIAIRIPYRTITKTVQVPQVRKQRVTFGVQAGIGAQYGLIGKRFDVGPSFGIGVQYNF